MASLAHLSWLYHSLEWYKCYHSLGIDFYQKTVIWPFFPAKSSSMEDNRCHKALLFAHLMDNCFWKWNPFLKCKHHFSLYLGLKIRQLFLVNGLGKYCSSWLVYPVSFEYSGSLGNKNKIFDMQYSNHFSDCWLNHLLWNFLQVYMISQTSWN